MLSVNRRISDIRSQVADWRSSGRTVGFVPTMGALHEGHGALIRASIEQCDRTVVSVFVNPLQFDRKEDLLTYPRDDKADQAFIEDLGAHALFLPSVEEMYPQEQWTILTQKTITNNLDGNARPGFFDGILTVVLKLFHMVHPDVAFFGLKDYQQVAVIRRMVADLNMEVEIRGIPTAREPNGVAYASRNKLLSEEDRPHAPLLYQALQATEARFHQGVDDVVILLDGLRKALAAIPNARIDYADLVDGVCLQLKTEKASVGDVLALAVYLGSVRLIDNLILSEKNSFLS